MESKKEIAEALTEEVRGLPDGYKTSLCELLEECWIDTNKLTQEQFFAIYNELLKSGRKAHISIETVESEGENGQIVSDDLPYNKPFVVRNNDAQIKCPRCGSKNTAFILYGMPAFSKAMQAKIDAGRLRLGGCCISGSDPAYYCNDCKRHFGARAVTNIDGQETPITDAVSEIEFSKMVYRAAFQPPHVIITKTRNGARVKITGYENRFPFESVYEISTRKWKTLVNSLYNGLYLNDWKRRFENMCIINGEKYIVLDGENWTLTIKLYGRQKRTYFGDNGYPPYWDEFMKLMKPYLKR
ncbi:MAG: hypothetical protein J5585_06880 [Clostridia bacterium]|nr:hypothetical protein [Clostridia bacterium]